MAIRYQPVALVTFAQALLRQAGLETASARDVAEVLVEGDLLGKTTHGLALLPAYLQNLESGKMTRRGAPKVVKKSAATLLLDAHYLPGPLVVRRALAWAMTRAKKHGVATVSIRRCHHIACLEAYLRAVTDHGLAILLMCSDPANAVVAPPHGRQGVYSPNPIGAGFPTLGEPILIDTTTSSHSNAQLARKFRAKERCPFAALQTSAGALTNDPAVMFTKPPGSILPVGGRDLGHKGFAFALIVEALTNALGGQGRAQKPARWGASVWLQVIDPGFFGGRAAFARETQFFAAACRKSRARPREKIRLPGEVSLARRREQLRRGVELHPEILPALRPWMEKLGVPPPTSLKPRRH
ncbi:MAG TPA: Ldh family oxidoreductase [Opitutales bacterium]|nr:Ldh family oxidoreductase [Opitutales bacterium]